MRGTGAVRGASGGVPYNEEEDDDDDDIEEREWDWEWEWVDAYYYYCYGDIDNIYGIERDDTEFD